MFIDRLTSSSWHKAKRLLVSVLALGSISSAPVFAQVVNEPPLFPPSGPYTYYVSKNGNNTDGRTWATAWNEMDQIKWSQINLINNYHGADRIVIDGGARRMIYRTPLKVQPTGAAYFGFSISLSTEAGHNGQAVIAPPADSKGIEITNGGGLTLTGSKRSGILVYGAKDGLYLTGDAPIPVSVSNIEISHCSEAGIVASSPYHPIGMSQLIVHDNATNVIVPTSGYAPGGPQFNKCWIYNSSYHRADSDGIRVDGGNSYTPPIPAVSLSNSVLGPGLRDAVNCVASSVQLTNCLVINSTRNNFSGRGVRLENVTSFMTRLNPQGMAHAALKMSAPSTMVPPFPAGYVKKSIVYGGMVDVPTTIPGYPYYPPGTPTMVPFPLTVENNTQFRTTGNTTLLSPSMVDPRFAHPAIGLLPAHTPVPLLMQLDFSLRADSPAAGTGSTITSIRGLLNSFN